MSNKSVWEILKYNYSRIVYKKSIGIILALFYLVTMLICSLLFHKIGGYGVETDFYQTYVPEAKSFLTGGFLIDAFRGPIYPILLSLFQKVFLDYYIAGLFINVLSASLALWFIFELFTSIFDRNIAFLSTIFVIFNPIFVQFTYSVGTDMLFFLCSYITLYLFLRRGNDIKTIVLLALFTALAYLIRYNGIFLLSIVPIVLLLNVWGSNFKKNLLNLSLYVLLFMLFISPWCIYTYINKGEFFYNHNYWNVAYEYIDRGKIGWDTWYSNLSQYHSIYSIISYNPIHFLIHFISNVFSNYLKFINLVMGLLVGIFSTAGIIFFVFSHKKNIKQTAYLIISLIFLAIVNLVFYRDRFYLFLIPAFTAFCVKFLLEINYIKPFNFSSRYIYAMIAIMFYVSLCWTISYSMRKINSGPNEILGIRNWFKNNYTSTVANPNIAAGMPHIAYYLGMNFNNIPISKTYNELYAKLKKENINYLYLSKKELYRRTNLFYLIDTSKTFQGLKAIYCDRKPTYVLYKVN